MSESIELVTDVRSSVKSNKKFKRRVIANLPLLIMAAPATIAILIFNYIPMAGMVIAFKNVRFDLGIWGSPWVGFDNFKFFFTSQDAWRITRNTVMLNASFIIFGLVFSLMFALILNEIRNRSAIKFYQTVYFFPYFLSWVVVSYALYAFLNVRLGIINGALKALGADIVPWYSKPEYWPVILIVVYLWKNLGYFSVIYYAGIMGIDHEYYEAALIDGANKIQMTFKITIPLLTPLIAVIVLLQIGKIFYADFGMFYFLPMDIGTLYPTTDVIDTYVYRALRVTGDIGMASAAGFYQSVVGFSLVLFSNYLVKRINPENAVF